MTITTIDDNINDLERQISSASDTEKAKVAERLRALLTPMRTVTYLNADQDEDLFNNVPV